MFTGIIEELGAVESIAGRGAARLKVRCATVAQDMMEGASIAVNGVCLTAVDPRPDSFCADLSPETLRRSNLGDLRAGSRVNLERPLSPTGRLSGHIVQGHVDGTGEFLASRPWAMTTGGCEFACRRIWTRFWFTKAPSPLTASA